MFEYGKLSETAHKRWIGSAVKDSMPPDGCRIRRLRDSCRLDREKAPAVGCASATAVGDEWYTAALAVHQAVNRLAASGGQTRMVMLQLTLSCHWAEEKLKAMMAAAAQACSGLGVILGQSDAVAAGEAVGLPVVTATAIGEADGLFTAKAAMADQDVLLAGYAGWCGSVRLAGSREQELEAHFNPVFLEQLWQMDAAAMKFSAMTAICAAASAGVHTMYALGEGGVFTGLWELADREGLGIRAHLKRMPIRQETVEICDLFEISPYEILSTGALLLVADRGEKVREALAAAGIPASIIGHLTSDHDRVILNDDEVRYLEPFKKDIFMQTFIKSRGDRR